MLLEELEDCRSQIASPVCHVHAASMFSCATAVGEQKITLVSTLDALLLQVCKALHEGIASNHFYWDRHTNELMSARYALPLGTFSKTSFTRFHMLVHDLVLCRDCGAFADWPAGQKICRRCWQVQTGLAYVANIHEPFVSLLFTSTLLQRRQCTGVLLQIRCYCWPCQCLCNAGL